MLTEEQEKRIIDLYRMYYNDIKPLTVFVERKYHKFPKGLLKEYRDIYDHLSRCYSDDATDDLIEENIEKAEHHYERIRLDIYRYVCDYKRRVFVKWKQKYNKYDLQGIDNGDFWKYILKREDEGEKKFFEGRKREVKSVNEACDCLQESFKIYDDIMQTIIKNRDKIFEKKFKYVRAAIASQITGFVLGILASIVAAWIYSRLFGI